MKRILSSLILSVLLLTSVSCNAGADSSYPLVQKAGMDRMEELLLPAELVEENGYLRIKYVNTSYLLVLPHGFSVGTDEEGTILIDAEGKTLAHVGDTVQVSGGGGKADMIKGIIGRDIPDDCEGPYYIVGTIVKIKRTSTVEQSSGEENSEDQGETSGSTNEELNRIMEEYAKNPELAEKGIFPEHMIYAYHYGIDLDEAVRRFEIMNNAGPLGAALENAGLDNFGGFWIQHEPEFRLVAAFTGDGEETIAPYRKEYPELADFIEVRTVQYSYAELLDAQQEISDAVEKLGVFAGSATYVTENNVEVYVTDIETVDKAVREGKLTIPDCVKITENGEMETLE